MAGRSSCPECGTILRIRDRTFVGRRVNCPECKTALRIGTADQRGDFVSRRLTPDELAGNDRPVKGGGSPPDKIALPDPAKRSFTSRILESPLTVAWLLAVSVLTLFAVLALAPKHRFMARRAVPVVETEEDPVEVTAESEDPAAEEVSINPPVEEMRSSDPIDQFLDVAVSALEPSNVDGMLEVIMVPEASVSDTVPVESPPAPVKVDVETKLAQKLVSYKQIKPVSRRELIDALQEHLGAPIRYDDDELGASNLDQTITFELENTTVGGVIQKVSDGAGWKIMVEETGLRLTR
jgi:hypothetical protein